MRGGAGLRKGANWVRSVAACVKLSSKSRHALGTDATRAAFGAVAVADWKSSFAPRPGPAMGLAVSDAQGIVPR